jgi:DNA ligase-4
LCEKSQFTKLKQYYFFSQKVKAVEITVSEKYKTGCTLKFPRLEKFRPDKPWYECMSLAELEQLRNKNDGRLASGKHLSLHDEDGGGEEGEDDENYDENGEPIKKKKRAAVSRAQVKVAVGSIYRGIDASCVDKVSDMFNDKELCIIIEDSVGKKKNVETAVAKLGGKLTQNPSNFIKIFCYSSGHLTFF